MEIALLILSLALAICLYLLIFKPDSAPLPKPILKDSPAKAEGNKNHAASSQEVSNAKAVELQKAKSELQKAKDELKQSKQKLFEARERNKQLEAELKTQKQLERQALQETENTRLQLADLSTGLHKLRLELETQKPSSNSKIPSPPPALPQAAAAEPVRPAKIIRELSPAEKEKLENVERLIATEHNRAQELEKELKNSKIRFELMQRQFKTFQASSKLQKDKFRALEKRLNRTLLERDFILRAMRDLENRCGLQAAIAELPKEDFEEDAAAETSEDISELSGNTEDASEFAPGAEEMETPEAKNPNQTVS
jgi:hypothetical protein